ncbi:MAG: MFS transporter, partial [Clostridia bacterium]|nr:MFS transporter [Clostridia bacterium]
MAKTCFTAAMASIVSEHIMTKSQVGFIVAAFYIIYAPLQMLGGVFADKYDPEKLIIIGLIGSSLSNLIVFINQNYYVVLCVWIFNAIIQFGLYPSVFKIISSQIVSTDRKSSAYLFSFSSTAGLILSYAVAAAVPRWYYNFAISAAALFALAAVLIVLTAVMKPYMKPDVPQETDKNGKREPEMKVSSIKVFSESGFIFLTVISLLISAVGNSVKTLSSTRLMETYEKVSPGMGNVLNILVVGTSIVALVSAKAFIYPRIIKSAPTGVFVMLIVTLAASAVLLFNNIGIVTSVISMCVISGSYSIIWLFMNYCNLRFAKFAKSGTAAGTLNMSASMGFVLSTYGV